MLKDRVEDTLRHVTYSIYMNENVDVAITFPCVRVNHASRGQMYINII